MTIPNRTALRALAALLAILSISSCSSPRKLDTAALKPRLALLVGTPGETVAGEALLQRDAVVAFYQARKGQPAWELGPGAASMREAIAGIAADGLNPVDYHLTTIDSLIAQSKAQAEFEQAADLEILLSDAAAAMLDHVRYGRVKPASLDARWNVDSRQGAPSQTDALVRVAQASSPAAGIEQEKLNHFIYMGLKSELGRLEKVAAAGGWAPVSAGRAVAPGASDPRVPLVRARLLATGELPGDQAATTDSSAYEPNLVAAVKLFQERHRLDGNGALNAGTIEAMNVPVETRINQVKVNLERSRWVLPGLTGDFILVNLPAFKAYLIRGDKNVWETRTQIGKEARQTPSFRSDMKFVIFNPTWTVPPTILKEDVLGGQGGPQAALARKKLKIYDRAGKVVDASSVDWGSARAGNFPYTLRQDAGPDNALGRVKFMFPNPYDIYLHDTPSRDLFAAERRTFSSGCIRIEDPLGLAKTLLADQGYDDAKVDETIAAGKTKQVNLKAPLAVLIVYWTVSVGASGEVRYGPDVYDRDAAVLAALGAGSLGPEKVGLAPGGAPARP